METVYNCKPGTQLTGNIIGLPGSYTVREVELDGNLYRWLEPTEGTEGWNIPIATTE